MCHHSTRFSVYIFQIFGIGTVFPGYIDLEQLMLQNKVEFTLWTCGLLNFRSKITYRLSQFLIDQKKIKKCSLIGESKWYKYKHFWVQSIKENFSLGISSPQFIDLERDVIQFMTFGKTNEYRSLIFLSEIDNLASYFPNLQHSDKQRSEFEPKIVEIVISCSILQPW